MPLSIYLNIHGRNVNSGEEENSRALQNFPSKPRGNSLTVVYTLSMKTKHGKQQRETKRRWPSSKTGAFDNFYE